MKKNIAKKGPGVDVSKKRTYQGLVLAEQFESVYNLCLVNAPVECSLEKTIQMLERAGLEEIYVFASTHKEAVSNYITQRPKRQTPIIFIYSPDCLTLGESLRAVFSMKVINGPFVLTTADIVSDIHIGDIISKFEIALDTIKPLLMLKVFNHHEPLEEVDVRESSLVLYDSRKMTLKTYRSLERSNKVTVLENSKFQFKNILRDDLNHENMVLTSSLIDSGITIASIELLNYFSENFDFHTFRDDFLKDLLSSEINDDQVAIHVLPVTTFHKRITNCYQLFRASSLVLKNCSSKFYFLRDSFLQSRFNKIISKSAKIDRDSKIGNHVFIGDNVEVEEGVTINNSIILSNSRIAKDSVIENSFIGSGVQTANACHWSCVLLPFEKQLLDSETTLTNVFFDGVDWSELRWITEIELDSEEPRFDILEEIKADEHDFSDEIHDIIGRVREDADSIQGVMTELINLRLAENRSHSEMLTIIFKDIVTKLNWEVSEVMNLIKGLSVWSPLLLKFTVGHDEQHQLIKVCEVIHSEQPLAKFHLLVQFLYKEEILESEIIYSWFDRAVRSEHDEEKSRASLIEKFVQWLRAQDDLSNDDDEDDDDS